MDLLTSLFECETPAKPPREVLKSLFQGRIAMLYPPSSLYLHVRVYACWCLIWTGLPQVLHCVWDKFKHIYSFKIINAKLLQYKDILR